MRKPGYRTNVIALVIWLSASAAWGLMMMEFGINLDGYGHSYLEHPSLAGLLLFLLIAATIAGMGWLEARQKLRYGQGWALGLVLWIAISWIGALLLPLHYAQICGDAVSPHVCRAAAFATDAQLKRACLLGDHDSCSAIVRSGYVTQEQLCEDLVARCQLESACIDFEIVCTSDASRARGY